MEYLNENYILKIVELVKQRTGICIKDEQISNIKNKINKQMTDLGLSNYNEYYNYLLYNCPSCKFHDLVNLCTINYTFFMREEEHFNALNNIILPNIKNKIKDNNLRIWSASCSTGEEPYSILMTIHDFFGYDIKNWDTRILATDINTCALDITKFGVYNNNNLNKLKQNWKSMYFEKNDEKSMKIKQIIKDDLIIRKFNLNDDFYMFKRKFHVIFCRNTMLYFDENTKQQLIKKFYNSLESGGYLIISRTEKIDNYKEMFINLGNSIYQKI